MESRQRIGSVVSSCNRDVSSACNGDMSSRNGDATIDFQESESHEMPSTASDSPHSSPHVMLYGIEDVPPWYLNVTFAFQVRNCLRTDKLVDTVLHDLCMRIGSFVFIPRRVGAYSTLKSVKLERLVISKQTCLQVPHRQFLGTLH